jgi:tRNA U34 5-carboxymethylaminomethyl modifying enzyme MnmG/GidA
MDFEKHLEYNAYKDSLNEIFDKLDEVIYISNTIDYKKISILLSEIVQNFNYYNIDTIPSANVGKEGITVGGSLPN